MGMLSAKCLCRPPLSFDSTDVALPFIIQGTMTILGSIGVGNYARNISIMLSVPAMLSCSLGGIDGGFVLWYNSSNMLKC